ncbi:ATP-binding protein [Rhodospira trueperi]|uniref:Sensory/regulatory protein RpfC n=1 Tax=Rhodospira trueperi TaxID=69960 RepID=A0A1G7EH85_9PROT|nr:ATP-binding protein [Rhodospira trueperi]SDE63003.1 PAS domain S-box-containing protein [Rhodospira trueperi]
MAKDTRSAENAGDRALLARRIIVASAVVFMMMITGVVGYWTWQSHTLAMERAREVTHSFTLTYSAFTEQVLQNIADLLLEVESLQRPTPAVSSPPDLGAFLRLRRSQTRFVRELLIADADGTVTHWTGAWPPPDIARHPGYLVYRDTGATVEWLSPVCPDLLADDRFTVAFARTIRDTDGTPQGSVFALIDQETFSAAFDTILETKQASVALVHFDGTIMVRLPDPGNAIGSVIRLVADRPTPGPAQSTFVLASPVDNVVRVISERRVGRYPLIAAVTIARDAALAPWRRDVSWGVSILVLAGAAVAFLSYALLRQVRLQALAQDALQRQYTVLAAQQETSTDGILVVDETWTVRSWNNSFRALWEFTDADMDTGDAAALLDKAKSRVTDPDGFVQRIQDLYANLEIDELDGTEIALRDGRILERYSRALRSDGGTPWGRAWFYRDVTARRHDEKTLRESEQRFRDVANAADEYIWEVDADGHLTFVTERAVDILGYAITDMLGRVPFEFIDPEDLDWTREVFEEASRACKPFTIREYRAVRADGQRVWQRTSAVPVLDEQGDLRGYRGATMSLDAIKARELEMQDANRRLEEQANTLVELAKQLDHSNRELRRVQERFDLAMRGTTDGIYDWDLLTNRIILSPRWCEMLGLGAGETEVSPAYWTARIHPDDYPGSIQALSDHLAGASAQYRHVHRMRHRNGHDVWVLDRAQVVRDVEGLPLRLVGTHADITEMRRYEEALRQAKTEAEAANAAKSRFLAVMSHEIRTPMTGVLGMADLLLTSHLTPRQRSFTETLKRSADSLLGLLDDILDFSKIEAGQLVLETVDFDPWAVIEDVVFLFAPGASEKGLVIEVERRTEPPPAVRGDPHRLRQILFNLIGNAIKFTHKGEVTVAFEADETLPDGGHRLTFAVRDSGIGLSPEQVQRLFQPFIQADDTTTRRFGGTGLGLAICRRLVNAMGGDIEVESAPGQGATFRFRVMVGAGDPARIEPLHFLPSPDPEANTPEHRPEPGTRLLLAEDTTANRLLIATMLERMGYTVDEAANGAEAVAAVRADPTAHALVIMDMQMPVMDGVKATRTIRALPGEPPPVIGLTADAMRENHAAYLASGLLDVMTKPVDFDRLEAAVARYARGVRWIEPEPEPDEADGTDTPQTPAAERTPGEVLTPLDRPVAVEPRAAGENQGDRTPGPVPSALVEPIEAEANAVACDEDRPPVASALREKADDRTEAPIFDAATLAALRTRLGPARVEPIVRSMLDNLDTQAESLLVAVTHRDWETAGRVGHSLTGLAAQFGAERLAQLCQSLQHACQQDASPDIDLRVIKDMVEQTNAAVRQWLDGPKEPAR